MGINVQHGGQGGVSAGQLIASAGQRNLDRQQRDAQFSQRLKQQRDMQMVQIDAQADLQRQAADDAMARTAMRAGLDEHIREQEFDRSLMKMKEQARLQASQWEYQYTAKQRQEIAKFNNARQAIQNNRSWSSEEKAQALKLIDLQQANIKPAMMPRDPSKPVFPDGQGVGEMWKDERGATVTRTTDGEVKLLVRPDQTPEYLAQKQKAERENELFKLKAKLASESIGTGDGGNAIYRTAEEINSIIANITGEAPPIGQQQEQQGPEAWWSSIKKMGVEVRDSDKKLPSQVGGAQAFFRDYIRRYGSRQNVPSEKREAFDECVKILAAYHRQINGSK